MLDCPKCDESFETGPELGQHIRSHDEETVFENPFDCADCHNTFELPSYWNPRLIEERYRLCHNCWVASWGEGLPDRELMATLAPVPCPIQCKDGNPRGERGLKWWYDSPWTCECGRVWVLDPIWRVAA